MPESRLSVVDLGRQFREFAHSLEAEKARLPERKTLFALQLTRALDLFVFNARRRHLASMLYYWGWSFHLYQILGSVEDVNSRAGAVAHLKAQQGGRANARKVADEGSVRAAWIEARERNGTLSDHSIDIVVARQFRRADGSAISYKTVERARKPKRH